MNKPVLPPPKIAPTEATNGMWQDFRDSAYWCPPFRVVFPLLCAIRVFGAVSLPISDCDETFNYWEPVHFLMYSRGQQTWEYRCVMA